MTRTNVVVIAVTVACIVAPLPSVLMTRARAQEAAANPQMEAKTQKDPTRDEIDAAVRRGLELLLGMQESMADGEAKAEWPYEGVYRVGRQIPIGYRVGGTSIVSLALLQAPGYGEDKARQEAVHRALRFVLDSSSDPLMNPDYDGGYDVRGWGYTYRLLFLLRLEKLDAVPPAMLDEVKRAIAWDVNAIQKTEIPRVGGWNYARAQGKDAVSAPSPFMTAPTLEALFNARAQGYAVDASVVNRAIETLVKQRCPTGSFVYSGAASADHPEPVPGSVGRMLAGETTLFLCGKSSELNIRAALDAFITHWEWLDKRRARQGTHEPPYMIAPYYFYYAHFYAARAIELLPTRDRREYRRRLARLLFSVRLDDGSWDDRVFPRSRNYGTAMTLMSLLMPDIAPPARWTEGNNPVEPGGG